MALARSGISHWFIKPHGRVVKRSGRNFSLVQNSSKTFYGIFFFAVFHWHYQTAYTYPEKGMGDQMVILLETLNAFSAGLGDRL